MTANGKYNAADVARTSSPLYPPEPVPAILLIIPVAAVTLRIS